nr:hypothetical protein [uncultured Cetobacterium sp.]
MKNKVFFLGALVALGTSAFAKEVIAQPVIVEDTTKEVVVEPVAVVEETVPVYVENKLFTGVSIGQSLEIDNTSGGKNIGEDVIFMNEVGLSTQNWDYTVGAGNVFSSDTDDLYKDGTARMELQAIRNFENGFAGLKWRAQDEYNRFYLRTGYDYGMFSGWMDAQYWAFNTSADQQDKMELEIMPANITVGPVTLGYYLDYIKYSGDGNIQSNGAIQEDSFDHQLRAYLPVYENEKLALGLEYRLGLHNSAKYKQDAAHRVYKDFEYNSLTLNANYAVTPAFNVFGYYRYDINNFESKGTGHATNLDDGKYYGEFQVGWNYTF